MRREYETPVLPKDGQPLDVTGEFLVMLDQVNPRVEALIQQYGSALAIVDQFTTTKTKEHIRSKGRDTRAASYGVTPDEFLELTAKSYLLRRYAVQAYAEQLSFSEVSGQPNASEAHLGMTHSGSVIFLTRNSLGRAGTGRNGQGIYLPLYQSPQLVTGEILHMSSDVNNLKRGDRLYFPNIGITTNPLALIYSSSSSSRVPHIDPRLFTDPSVHSETTRILNK